MQHRFLKLLTLFLLALPFAMPSSATAGQVQARLLLPVTAVQAGSSYQVMIEVDIEDGYHLNSNTPSKPGLIPVELSLISSHEGVSLGRIVYPKSEMKQFAFSKEKLSVFEGKVYIVTSISIGDEVKNGFTLKGKLSYQACNDQVCMMPSEVELAIDVPIGKGMAANSKLFKKYGGIAGATKEGGSLLGDLGSASGLSLFLLVFLGGLALNLTPCVYPLIPVTIGYFGANSGRSRGEVITHAFAYLLGMALMYSLLGSFAALTGSLFGELMQSSIVIVILVFIMLALAASMFGFWEIRVPSALLSFSSRSYGGLLGTLFMGFTVGIIAAPCVGPFVIALLTLVGERQDVLLGFSLFFTLAVGLGLPFVFLAIFSGMLQSLPRSGVWMGWVKKFFGLILLGMAVYFATPLLPDGMFETALMLLAIFGGFYLLWSGLKLKGGFFKVVTTVLSVGMIVGGAFIAKHGGGGHGSGFPFTHYTDEVYEQKLHDGKSMVLYFTADWCVPCRELKLFTFGDERVMKMAGELFILKIDLTTVEPEEKLLKERFGVKGVPTVIIYDKDGKEKTRFTGFLPADKFLKLL